MKESSSVVIIKKEPKAKKSGPLIDNPIEDELIENEPIEYEPVEESQDKPIKKPRRPRQPPTKISIKKEKVKESSSVVINKKEPKAKNSVIMDPSTVLPKNTIPYRDRKVRKELESPKSPVIILPTKKRSMPPDGTSLAFERMTRYTVKSLKLSYYEFFENTPKKQKIDQKTED